MFMPETEDMLPRSAPMPSSAIPMGHSDGIVKPTVPELSILFGQQKPQQQQHQQQQHQQAASASTARPLSSFASWKKQILPRVNFSPILTTELGPSTTPSPPSVGATTISSSPSSEYNFLPRTRCFDAERSSPSPVNTNQGYTVPGPATYTQKSFPAEVTPRLPNPDVLTICAGTQTEPESMSNRRDSLSSLDVSNLANKHDLQEVLSVLKIMRQEQQQLRSLCESLTQQQQQQLHTSSKTLKETGSQCELLNTNKGIATVVKRITPIIHDYIIEEEQVPVRVLPQFQSPRATPPKAQSTGYRVNTPQSRQTPPAPVMGATLPKPSTEKSLVMNELALKYLPQRQINELMDELHLSPKTDTAAVNNGTNSTPLRQIDNFTQSPSNMSNASYKYLKKYRLLPEEQLTYGSPQRQVYDMHKMQATGSPRTAGSPQCQQNPMLDLDHIRNKPKLI